MYTSMMMADIKCQKTNDITCASKETRGNSAKKKVVEVVYVASFVKTSPNVQCKGLINIIHVCCIGIGMKVGI